MKKFITYIFAVVVLAVSSVFTANAQYIKNPTDTTKISLYETPQYQDALHEFNVGQNMFFGGITDAALAKFLEMSGWEVKNVAPVDDNSLVVIDEYPGLTVKNTPEEANNEFLKRMILNSRNILSKKGTRAGIEAMYSMFGIFEKRYGDEYYFTID